MKFKRSGHAKKRQDEKGRVIISIRLQDITRAGQNVVKGNMTKTISIDDTKVGEVFEAIEKALFD